jgi:hypothetical protein
MEPEGSLLYSQEPAYLKVLKKINTVILESKTGTEQVGILSL